MRPIVGFSFRCTSLLHALGDDRWPRAVALLSEMRSLQVADNIISWNLGTGSSLDACCSRMHAQHSYVRRVLGNKDES